MAWQQVSVALVLVVAPMAAYFTRTDKKSATVTENAVGTGYTLAQALRMPGFWVFGGAIALFGLVSAGLGLFNEAVLGERGFDARTFHVFLAVTTLFALAGQFLCGWLNQHCSLARMTGIALILYGAGLATLPLLTTRPQLWVFAGIFGVAGGMITVVFFSVWGQAFGMAHLGQIQGAAQMLTVFASALGPLLFAHCHARTGSYTPLLLALAPVVLVFAGACWRVRLSPPPPATHRNSIR
jgi:MFS family permease